MNILAREHATSLRQAVHVAELISGLPAVATQDWCEKAAATLLPIIGSGICVTLIGQIDDRGVIQKAEATGVAGATTAEIGTLVGAGGVGGGTRAGGGGGGTTQTSIATVQLDPNDATLARVRTSLAQARELGWSPSGLGGNFGLGSGGSHGHSSCVVGTPSTLSTSAGGLGQVSRRWEGVPHGYVLLGATTLGPGGRAFIVELAGASSNAPSAAGGSLGETELSVLHAVLPLLAKRATLAIGGGLSESAHWLTAREQIILQHLLLGKSVREIAEELGRSPHTVHDHVKSLHRKLNASSRGELVARALGYVEAKPGMIGIPTIAPLDDR